MDFGLLISGLVGLVVGTLIFFKRSQLAERMHSDFIKQREMGFLTWVPSINILKYYFFYFSLLFLLISFTILLQAIGVIQNVKV